MTFDPTQRHAAGTYVVELPTATLTFTYRPRSVSPRQYDRNVRVDVVGSVIIPADSYSADRADYAAAVDRYRRFIVATLESLTGRYVDGRLVRWDRGEGRYNLDRALAMGRAYDLVILPKSDVHAPKGAPSWAYYDPTKPRSVHATPAIMGPVAAPTAPATPSLADLQAEAWEVLYGSPTTATDDGSDDLVTLAEQALADDVPAVDVVAMLTDGSPTVPASDDSPLFQCAACGDVLKSQRALDRHRASHKRTPDPDLGADQATA